VNGPVKPGDEITLQVQMIAPELAGKYCAFFRFVHGDNLRFGQKVWCDILVEVPAVQEMKQSMMQEEPKLFEAKIEEPVIEEASSLLNDSEQRVSSLLDEVIEQPVEPLVQEPVLVEKKEVEENKVDAEQVAKDAYLAELEKANIKDLSLAQNLKYMMDMGYLNFEINYRMLTRNNNDLVIAINKLCNNIVTDSIFQA